MKEKITICLLLFAISLTSCRQAEKTAGIKIIFLHHSTGSVIWKGATNFSGKKAALPELFEEYNKENNTNYLIKDLEFPKAKPYGWRNYPYDYYNIWVKNAGEKPFMEEPTLEILTKEYPVIIFKHCFPVSNIKPDQETPDINSDIKTIPNYKLQYLSLREKMNQYPDNKFILFTGAVQVKNNIEDEEALRAREFFTWVREEWDMPGDNIFLWDLYSLQTEGGLFFKEEFAVSTNDSHPSKDFAGEACKLLFNRIIDVIESNGSRTQLTGEWE